MKKLIFTTTAIATLAAALSLTANAEGTVYGVKDNSVKTTQSEGKQTVCIYKSDAGITADSIVYINQAETANGFGAATEFLLKAAPVEGNYTIHFNDTDPIAFSIGSTIDSYGVKMEKNGENANADGSYNVAFTANVSLGAYSSVIVKNGDTTLGYNLETTLSGNASAVLGIQLNGVPADKKGSIEVYLSSKVLELAEQGKEQ